MAIRDAIIAVDFDGTVVTHAYPHIGNDIGAGIGELSDAISTGVGERQELHASIRPGGGPGHEPLLLETADGSAEIALVHAQQAGYVSCAHGLSLADLERTAISSVEEPVPR